MFLVFLTKYVIRVIREILRVLSDFFIIAKIMSPPLTNSSGCINMGISFVDFINQIVSPLEESEKKEQFQLVCECSRGELKFDTLSNQVYIAEKNCNLRGVCAFVAKNKHQAKISSEKYLKMQQLDNQLKTKQTKQYSSNNEKTAKTTSQSRHKSLLDFIN